MRITKHKEKIFEYYTLTVDGKRFNIKRIIEIIDDDEYVSYDIQQDFNKSEIIEKLEEYLESQDKAVIEKLK